MACTDLPLPPPPTPLPTGVTIDPPPLPPLPGDLTLCCKLVQFNIPAPPFPLPPLVLNSGVATAINQFIAGITAYLDSLPLVCPKE